MPINSNHILVVGGAGYIGSHMVLSLQEAGYEPIVLDNLSRGHRHAVPSAKLIVGDVADQDLLNDLFSTYSFAAVMHFASWIDVAESVAKPLRYYQNNVAATLNLLEVMLQHQVKHFIFSSTAAVYGEPQYSPMDELHPLMPINPYGRSKLMVEEILQDLAKSDGLKFAILRYFNAAGADPKGRLREQHQPETHLIPILLEVASGLREHIKLNGNDYPTDDGTCIRDYVHVTDICIGHLLTLKSLLKNDSNLIYNIGTGKGYSIKEVLNAARFITGHPIETISTSRRAGDPAILIADHRKIKRELNWQPLYSDLNKMIENAWHASQVIQA